MTNITRQLDFGILVSLRENEYKAAFECLTKIKKTFDSQTNTSIGVELFIQRKMPSYLGMDENPNFFSYHNIEQCSLSKARNIAFRKSGHKYRYVAFFDNFTCIDDYSCRCIAYAIDVDIDIICGQSLFQSKRRAQPDDYRYRVHKERSRFFILRYPFIWSYIFKTDIIRNVEFDETVGVGSLGLVQCGEDTLFLADIIRKNPKHKFTYFPALTFTKPPRQLDNSKRLQYSFGQGVIWRQVFNTYKKEFNIINVSIHIILFFINGILMLALRKEKSFAILVNRVRGFFSKELS